MDISLGELALIALIAFLVLGPKELVVRANQLGRWIRKLRTEVNNFKILAEEEIMRGDAITKHVEALKSVDLQNIEYKDSADKKAPGNS